MTGREYSRVPDVCFRRAPAGGKGKHDEIPFTAPDFARRPPARRVWRGLRLQPACDQLQPAGKCADLPSQLRAVRSGPMRSRLLLLLPMTVLLVVGCSVGYDYNPRAINCSLPENAQICHPNFMP